VILSILPLNSGRGQRRATDIDSTTRAVAAMLEDAKLASKGSRSRELSIDVAVAVLG
jgi:hypothetical protein